MDMGQSLTIARTRAIETAANVVDLNAFRLKKQNACKASQETSAPIVPSKLDSLISELSEVVKEGERKFLATL